AGGADTLSVAAYVTVAAGPVAAFSASDSSGTAPLEVTFTDLSTGADAWAWDFGDGITSTAQHPVHSYTAAGVYTVTLIAGGACGADTLAVPGLIAVDAPPLPVATFAATPTAGCAPLDVAFTDQSTGTVAAWAWDFGDGGTSVEQHPAHVYGLPGAYTVTLIASGDAGADTLAVPGAVTVGTPVGAAFAVGDTLGAPPLAVAFSDQSTGGPTGWLWDFGDGATDTVPDPQHIYLADGTYSVTLIVTNGCSADTLVMAEAVVVSSLSSVGLLVPSGFGLAQNYPNPFNPSTTLTYALTRTGPVRLEIFNTAGRRVAMLVDEERPAGEHSVVWQPQGLASGVYFARFSAEGRGETRRLVLLK
ncbi:MAG: PKD domain-containing protein, partial [Gemmatimonadales bacterium]